MTDCESAPRVRVAEAACGTRTYLVDVPPEALPPVRARDLLAAWDNARSAALAEAWGHVRLFRFRFRRAGAEPTDLVLADADACCWAAAVDHTVGLRSTYGLSLCLRLLALVDVLTQAAWATQLVTLRRDGASLHPGLVRAAASCALTPEAQFDPSALHSAVHQPPALAPPGAAPSGAPA
jgi:hypothetical protein